MYQGNFNETYSKFVFMKMKFQMKEVYSIFFLIIL